MSTISTKINLTQFKHTIEKRKTKSGRVVDCLVIPIELNNLYKGEKNVYADFIGYELKEKNEDKKLPF